MCGRVVLNLDPSELEAIAKVEKMNNESRYKKSYNLTPGSYLPCYAFNKKSSIKTETVLNENTDFNLEPIKWGTKNQNGHSFINARIENIFLYHKSFKRCVVIIQGYYEWKSTKLSTMKSQPYYIHDKERSYLLLAAIYKTTDINIEDVNFIFR